PRDVIARTGGPGITSSSARGAVPRPRRLSARADGFTDLPPGHRLCARLAHSRCQFDLGGVTPPCRQLDRHHRRQGRILFAGLRVVVLEVVRACIGLRSDVFDGASSHDDHLRYFSRAGRMAWTMAISPCHSTTPTSTRAPVSSGPMNIAIESSWTKCRTG